MKNPSISCHFLAFNESRFIPYTLRYYKSFCDRVTCHDLGSKDGTQEIARSYGAEVKQWDTNGEFNDHLNLKIKSECAENEDSDWWIVVDCDELLVWPEGVERSFEAYEKSGVAFIKPSGYEMLSSVFPTTGGQVFEEIKCGGLDNYWYGKVSCFSKKLVSKTQFAPGAHSVDVTLTDGRMIRADRNYPMTNPPCRLCHFHQIAPIEEIAAKYDATRARMSEVNIKHRFGNFEPGIKHATDKRNAILSRLERVIP